MRRYFELRALRLARRLVLWSHSDNHSHNHQFDTKDAAMGIKDIMRFYGPPSKEKLPTAADVRGILR